MGIFSWVILTNCSEGKNHEFEEWYDEIHIPDLLRVPGIVSATRGRATRIQAIMTEEGAFALTEDAGEAFQYVAIYKLETETPELVLREVMRRAFTSEMRISEDLSGVKATLFEDA